MRNAPGMWTLLALGILGSVWSCDNRHPKPAGESPLRLSEAGKAADLQKVEEEIRKTEKAVERTKAVGTQLRLLWPLYRKCVTFQRDTSPDIAVVLSATVPAPGEAGSAQPAIFHMLNTLNDITLAYGSAGASIRQREMETREGTAPVVNQILGLYGTAIDESRDCTGLMQRLQQDEWWCREDQDFQKYVDLYHPVLSEAGGNSCFLIRDAIRSVCGQAYSTMEKASRLYISE